MRIIFNGTGQQKSSVDLTKWRSSGGLVYGTGLTVCRIFRRDMDQREYRKIKIDPQARSKRPRSASFSGSCPNFDQQRPLGMRRPSVAMPSSRAGRHRSGLPVPTRRETVQKYAWDRISDASMGNKHLGMQDKPRHSSVSKVGAKRSFFPLRARKDLEISEVLRFYGPEDYKLTQPQVPSLVPGGSVNDPLNLQAVARGEELPVSSPDIREPDLSRFDLPANNFIPTNQKDPLGLMQPADDQRPVAQKYDLEITKIKRKRRRAVKAASHSNVGSAETKNVAVPTATCTSGDEGLDQPQVHDDAGQGDSEVDVSFVVDPSEAVAGEKHLEKQMDTENEKVVVDIEMESAPAKDTDIQMSSSGPAGINPSRLNQVMAILGEPSVSKLNRSSIQPSTSRAHVSEADSTTACVSAAHTVDDIDQCVDSVPVKEGVQGEAEGAAVQTMASKAGHHSPTRTGSVDGGEAGTLQQSRQRNPAQKLEHMQHEHLRRTFDSTYPVPMSPLDDEEKRQVAQNRKALKKALKIVPSEPEEQQKVIKAEQKREREFKRLWRYPNLKSPEDEEIAQPSNETLTLKIDTSMSSVKSHRERPVLQGPLSRTVDSIVSPVLRPDPGHVRKRRRTVSDGSSDSAKSLTFRRSASPETPPSKRQRRLSSTSTQSKQTAEQPEIVEKQTTCPVKYAKNSIYRYGNYFKYYGYRTPDMAPDYRLQYFRREWFEGMDVLDIGCNAGAVTLAVAQLFHPMKIVGMDIDPNLIRMARRNIKTHQTRANMHQMAVYPVSANEYGPIEPLPALTNPSNIFPKNVMFMQGNYVLEKEEDLNEVQPEFDTILALSITKWIHLNHGDEGLKRAFARMFQQLRPGGRLILEPQSWVSYRRRKKLTPTIYKNYNSIQLKPEQFPQYLIESVGFCSVNILGQPYNPSKGFMRRLLLFTKFKEPKSPSPPKTFGRRSDQEPSVSICERMATLAGYSAHSSTHLITTPDWASPYSNSPMHFLQNYVSTSPMASNSPEASTALPPETEAVTSNQENGQPMELDLPNGPTSEENGPDTEQSTPLWAAGNGLQEQEELDTAESAGQAPPVLNPPDMDEQIAQAATMDMLDSPAQEDGAGHDTTVQNDVEPTVANGSFSSAQGQNGTENGLSAHYNDLHQNSQQSASSAPPSAPGNQPPSVGNLSSVLENEHASSSSGNSSSSASENSHTSASSEHSSPS